VSTIAEGKAQSAGNIGHIAKGCNGAVGDCAHSESHLFMGQDTSADRGRGQAKPLTYDNAVSMLTMGNPLDEAIVALAFMAGLRRGITHKLTAHSGRVGLASELTARGASTTETMLAGNWKTAPRACFRGGYQMVSHPVGLGVLPHRQFLTSSGVLGLIE